MKVSYKKMWVLCAEKEMSKAELRRRAGLSSATFTKLRKNQEVTIAVMLKLADVLDCNAGDMMDFIKDDIVVEHEPEEYFLRGGNHLTDKEFEKAMDIIATAISDAGYNVREQLTGFLLTGDPTYITRRNDARTLIKSIDQEQLRRYINGLSE